MIWYPEHDNIPYRNIYIPTNSHLTHRYYEGEDYKPNEECINVWYFDKFKGQHRRGHQPATILYFHGNSGNISHRRYVVDICKRFGMNLLLVDYCGYGDSDGTVNPHHLYRDGALAYDFLASQESHHDIIVWGESLGGTVATYVATNYPCKLLILLASFSSLTDVLIESGYPSAACMVINFMAKILFHPMESKNYIIKIKCPVAIMHSTDDTLIPYQCGKILYNSIKHTKKVFITIKGDHAQPKISNQKLRQLLAFANIQVEDKLDEVEAVRRNLEEITKNNPGLVPEEL